MINSESRVKIGKVLWLGWLIVLMGMVGCQNPDPPPVTVVTSVQMTANPANPRVGQTTIVGATPVNAGGVPVAGVPCVFTTGDSSILTVSPDLAGALGTGVSVGVTTVTAVCGPAQNSVTITVRPPLRTFSVSKSGTGSGSVFLNPAGGTYDSGTSVTTTANALAGSTFTGWGGACAAFGSQTSCTVIVNANLTATATFTQTAIPPCTYTYSAWSACRSDSTQTRTVDSAGPSGCVGTPILSQRCVYTPNTDCCDCNFDVYCTVFGAGGCWYCRNSTIVSGTCQAPAGHLTSPGRCGCDPGLYQVCQ